MIGSIILIVAFIFFIAFAMYYQMPPFGDGPINPNPPPGCNTTSGFNCEGNLDRDPCDLPFSHIISRSCLP